MVFATFSGEMRGVWPCAASWAIASEVNGRVELCLWIYLSQFGRRFIKRVHFISYVISPVVHVWIAYICSCSHFSVSISFLLS